MTPRSSTKYNKVCNESRFHLGRPLLGHPFALESTADSDKLQVTVTGITESLGSVSRRFDK